MENLFSVLKPSEILKLKLRFLYEKNGYTKYEMSRFEEYAFYLENRNFLINDSVITFTDLDGRLLALKPDVTLSIAKNYQGGAQRVYYTENVYRPDRAKRSFKEIEQMGLECVGGIDSNAVSDVVVLAAQSMRLVSQESILEISHCGFIRGLLNAVTDDKRLRLALSKLIAEKNVHGVAELAKQAEIDEDKINALLKAINICGDYESVITKAKSICISDEMQEALDELEMLNSVLRKSTGLCDIRFDMSLHGEEDYYNGIVFCGYVKGLPFRVLSGGRYDALLKRLGKECGALGFALYLDELQLMFENEAAKGE